MPLSLPDPQLPGNPQDALQSIQRNFEALAQTLAPPVPSGTVFPYAASSAPNGYLICDGSEIAVKDYPVLDALLGTTYGSRTNGSGGAGSSHFRLPNLKGRVIVGRDSSDADFDLLGEARGSKTHTLAEAEIPSHTHTQNAHSHTTTVSSESHSHSIYGFRNDNTTQTGAGARVTNLVGPNDAWDDSGSTDSHTHSHTVTVNNATATNNSTGGGGAHNNIQPSLVMNYIIKT